jgi:hypothetical protein
MPYRSAWLTLAGALLACSGGTGGNESVATDGALRAAFEDAVSDQLVAAFEVAVRDYVQAFATGDTDAAWAMVSDRCQDTVDEREYRAAVAASGELYPEMHAENIRVEVDGDQGRASYETGTEIGPYEEQPWRLEVDGWHWDDC